MWKEKTLTDKILIAIGAATIAFSGGAVAYRATQLYNSIEFKQETTYIEAAAHVCYKISREHNDYIDEAAGKNKKFGEYVALLKKFYSGNAIQKLNGLAELVESGSEAEKVIMGGLFEIARAHPDYAQQLASDDEVTESMLHLGILSLGREERLEKLGCMGTRVYKFWTECDDG